MENTEVMGQAKIAQQRLVQSDDIASQFSHALQQYRQSHQSLTSHASSNSSVGPLLKKSVPYLIPLLAVIAAVAWYFQSRAS